MARAILFLTALMLACQAGGQERPQAPRIDGDWWQVAGNPDLGSLTTERQEPVDFGIWQADDGTWQLWSCIRKTRAGVEEGGKTRLFHGWETDDLTASDWQPKGIQMQADPAVGETAGGLQAPHVIRYEGLFYLFYGGWDSICLATSTDGKTFTRRLDQKGKSVLFSELNRSNTRDPMVSQVDGVWYCYYTAHRKDEWGSPSGDGAVYARTSADLFHWSVESHRVAWGGNAGTTGGSAECPHVVSVDGYHYLFRTQQYGENNLTRVYRSKDPLMFGIDQDESYLIGTLPVAAPELIKVKGQWYIASLLPTLDGIRMARLKWVADDEQPAGIDRTL